MAVASLEKLGRQKSGKEFLLEVTKLKQEFQPSIEVVSEDPVKFALGCESVWDLGDIDPSDESAIGGCTAGINTFNVTSNGIITPCAVLPIKMADSNGKTAAEIKREYIQSPLIKGLLTRSFEGKCGSCNLKRLCGGCRAIAYALKGDILGSDDTCWF